MLTRRINLTLGISILGALLVGVLVFALTTNEPAIGGSEEGTQAGQGTSAADSPAPVQTVDDSPVDASPSTALTPAAEGTATPEEVVAVPDGAAIWSQHCASCHGDSGGGGSGGAVDDIDLLLVEVIDITTNGVPRMPAFKDELTEEEIKAVAEWTLELADN